MSLLETPYLAKVILNFITSADLRNFIEINSKCEEVVKCLKVNPLLTNYSSINWFLHHFKVDTIELHNVPYDNLEVLKNTIFVRNPSLEVFNRKGLLNVEFAQTIFPKIKRIQLVNNRIEGNDEDENNRITSEASTNEFIIQNSKYLSSLDYIEGDIELITRMMENFTDDGKEIYIKLPKRIVLKSRNGHAIELIAEVVELVKRLEKCIPNNNTVSVSIVVFEHATKKEYLEPFKRIQYYYRCIKSEMCDKFNDCLFTENGKLWINGAMKNNNLNHIIEKAYPNTIYHRFVRNKSYGSWTVPECVKSLVFETHFNAFWEKNNVIIQMDFVEFLTLSNCTNLLLENNSLHSLKELKISKSSLLSFGQIELDRLERITIESSRKLLFKNTSLHSLLFIKAIDCNGLNIESDVERIRSLVLIQCSNVVIYLSSFENKKVYLESCEEIHFKTGLEVVEEINPMKFCDVEIAKVNEMMKNVFEFPSTIDYETKSPHIFKMSPFIPKSNRIEFEGRNIKRIIDIRENQVDMAISSNFYTTKNGEELFRFISLDGNETYTKDFRYFEIKVKGITFASIGFIDKDRYNTFENRHVGWDKYSIGYHADDGCIFNGIYGVTETNIPYGNEIGTEKVAGVGYCITKKEVFFTCDGKFVRSFSIVWENISAAIACDMFVSIVLNTGEEPFIFDLTTLPI